MRILYVILVCMMTIGSAGAADGFLRVEGQNIVKPNGERLYIQGTNLGNWLNPEGYMFGMKTTNSPRFIDEMLCELVGPTNAAHFWKEFKENYILRTTSDLLRRVVPTRYGCPSTISCSRKRTTWDLTTTVRRVSD